MRRASVAVAKGFTMDTSDVRVEIKDHIATVTMDRPPVNAMSQNLVEGMAAAFDSFDDLPEVRVAILTGAGNAFAPAPTSRRAAAARPRASGVRVRSGFTRAPGARLSTPSWNVRSR